MWVAPALSSGLGNRLFQLAAAAGAAELWGRELVFYMPACKESPHGPLASIFRMFPQLRIVDSKEDHVELVEPPLRFYQFIPVGPAPAKNGLVCGFRQSPQYFPSRFAPDWDSALGGAVCRRKIEELAGLQGEAERRRTYALHVRLGDYRILPHHQTELSQYYVRALERVPPGSRIQLFSDEPNACQQLFKGLAGVQVTMAATASDVESLYEMSLCLGGTITANSTFSWWGAWFAHHAGAAWATYPNIMGNGMPEPVDLVPDWGIVIEARGPK